MHKSTILKIFACIILFFVVAATVWFMLVQSDKKRGASTAVPSESARVYTEEEKVKILQDLAGAKVTTTMATAKIVSVPVKVTSDTLSAQEGQKRIQTLKQISPATNTASTAGPSDAEKLRILNSLGGATQ